MFNLITSLVLLLGAGAFYLWAPSIVPGRIKRLSSAGVGLLGLLFFFNGLFFNAKPGTAYAIQYLWGGDKAVTSQGIKIQGFGRTIPISFEIAVQDTLGEEHTTDDEIYYRAAQLREFSDAIKARVAGSVVVAIDYNNEELFLQTADKIQSEGKLVFARIIPVYDQALKNTCKLMSAQDYISGKSAEFDYYLKDQMERGMYLTEEVYEEQEESPILDTLVERKASSKGGNKGQTQKRYVIKRDRSGEPMRDASSSLHRYGITVRQAAVTFVDWEPAFDVRLDHQKEQVAQTQLEKQKAEKSYYERLAAIQQGEADKAREQKKLEKEQITKIIAAETKAKEAQWKVIEEKNLFDASKISAQRVKINADAEYYKNSKLVSAGLTPQERVEWDYKTAVDVAKEIKGLQLPYYFVTSSGGTGKSSDNDQLVNLITALFMQDLRKEKK